MHDTRQASEGATPERRRRVRRWALVAVGVLVAGAVALTGFRAWLTQAPRAVTVGEAVERFSSSSSGSGATTVPSATGPEPGVYVYATTGQEEVDALGGDTHTYPAVTTITVTATECGFRMEWVPLAGRSDTTDLCRSGGGIEIRGTVNVHEFFHLSQGETFACDPGAWWVPPAGTTTWTASCTSGNRTTTRTGRAVGTEQLAIGGATRDAVHVRYDDVISGDSNGTGWTDLWLDPGTGLVLREVTGSTTGNDNTLIGHVTFDETIDVTLTGRG